MSHVWHHCSAFDRNGRAAALQWHHNERDSVSNHRRLDGLLNRLFRRRLKETSKLRVSGLCEGNYSPHKWPVTRRLFPFDDVIIGLLISFYTGNLGANPVNITPNTTRPIKKITKDHQNLMNFFYLQLKYLKSPSNEGPLIHLPMTTVVPPVRVEQAPETGAIPIHASRATLQSIEDNFTVVNKINPEDIQVLFWRNCCHFDEFSVAGCTESSHFDNFRYSQWGKFRHRYFRISVARVMFLYVIN